MRHRGQHDEGKEASTRSRVLRRLDSISLAAIKVLDDGLRDPNPAIRVTCAREILDRRFGKPRQEQTVDVRVSSMSEQHLAALRELAQAGLRALPVQHEIIDITPDRQDDD